MAERTQTRAGIFSVALQTNTPSTGNMHLWYNRPLEKVRQVVNYSNQIKSQGKSFAACFHHPF